MTDPWGNPLSPDDQRPVNPQPEDYPPGLRSEPRVARCADARCPDVFAPAPAPVACSRRKRPVAASVAGHSSSPPTRLAGAKVLRPRHCRHGVRDPLHYLHRMCRHHPRSHGIGPWYQWPPSNRSLKWLEKGRRHGHHGHRAWRYRDRFVNRLSDLLDQESEFHHRLRGQPHHHDHHRRKTPRRLSRRLGVFR